MPLYARIDPAKVAALFRSPTGPVVREEIRRGKIVQERAKTYVGVSESGHGEVGGRQQHLRDAIVLRIVAKDGQTVVTVGADLPHAKLHHDDTRPHIIVPVRAKVLRFVVGGVITFATVVNHPGTKGTKYLERGARDAGLRYVPIG